MEGRNAEVAFLLDRGANTNVKDREYVYLFLDLTFERESCLHSGTTPLHWAAHRGFVAIAGMLLDKRADVDSEDNGFVHPLKLFFCDACTFNHAQ